jgi:hypothetical protein
MSYLRKTNRSRTLARLAAMRRLVDMLRAGEMSRDAICEKMRISPAGCRKYVNAMIDGRIAEISTNLPSQGNAVMGQSVYRLIGSEAQIDQFFRDELADKVKRTKPRQIEAATGRHFHILADDRPWQTKFSRGTVARDPLALPLEFFRPMEARA